MFGIQTLLASGIGTLLIYVLIGIAVFGIAYHFYRRWHHQHRLQQNSEFAPIHHAREQRTAQAQKHTVDALRIEENADQILTRIQQQQTHLKLLITEFEAALKNSGSIDMKLEETNISLQQTVILPFGALLQEMQTYYKAISDELLRLSLIYITSNKALVAREKELAHIVHRFTEIESTAQVGISQLKNIPAIHESLNLKERIKGLEEALDALTIKTKELLNTNELQEKLIANLKNRISKTKPLDTTRNSLSHGDLQHLLHGTSRSDSDSEKNPYTQKLGLF